MEPLYLRAERCAKLQRTWRDRGGLDAASGWRDEIALAVHLVEDGADDVEGRRQVRATVAEEDTDGLVLLGHERLVCQGAFASVEDHRLRVLVQACRSRWWCGVDDDGVEL